jgi:chaperonin GroES
MKKAKTTTVKSSGPKLKPLADRVLIEEVEEKAGKTDSGIYIPDSAKEDRGAKRGTVVAVGAGRYEDGDLIPMSVSVGDTVLFQWGDKISLEGKEYFLARESEIIAVIK